jgi:hypothetical protein
MKLEPEEMLAIAAAILGAILGATLGAILVLIFFGAPV